MDNTASSTALIQALDHWLHEQIRPLSVAMLKDAVMTCTACGDVTGEYIVEYQGDTLRLPASDTYALLKFVAATTP